MVAVTSAGATGSVDPRALAGVAAATPTARGGEAGRVDPVAPVSNPFDSAGTGIGANSEGSSSDDQPQAQVSSLAAPAYFAQEGESGSDLGSISQFAAAASAYQTVLDRTTVAAAPMPDEASGLLPLASGRILDLTA